MVSGSQLQVAKLAQMCPAATSSAQRCPAAPSSAQWRPAMPSGNPGQNPGGAPWSTKCPFKTNSPSFYVRLKTATN